MKRNTSKRTIVYISVTVLSLFSILTAPGICRCEESNASSVPVSSGSTVPNRYGLALLYANTYKPVNDIGILVASGVALFDYEKVWHHRAPENLRFKVEVSAGSAMRDKSGFVGAAHILALYYLRRPAAFTPYIEGGIGGIYTSFRIKGQGLRFNFNPQLGIGADFRVQDATVFTALRLHHISNGGLNHENRGINSIALQLGRYF